MKASSSDYFYECISKLERYCITLYKDDALQYLLGKYPAAEIFTGVEYGMIDVMIAQTHNINFGEFDNEFDTLETIIIL